MERIHPVGIVSREFTVPVAIPGSIFCICSLRQRRQSRNLFSRLNEGPIPLPPFRNPRKSSILSDGAQRELPREGAMDGPILFFYHSRKNGKSLQNLLSSLFLATFEEILLS